MATLRNKRKLAAITREAEEEHPKTASHETRAFVELTRNISHRFLRKLKAESLKNCHRSPAGESSEFWVLCLNKLDEFLLTHRYGRTPEPFREHYGTQMWKTRNEMRIVPRMIFILKWEPPSISPVIQMTQTQTRLVTHTVEVVGSISNVYCSKNENCLCEQ